MEIPKFYFLLLMSLFFCLFFYKFYNEKSNKKPIILNQIKYENKNSDNKHKTLLSEFYDN